MPQSVQGGMYALRLRHRLLLGSAGGCSTSTAGESHDTRNWETFSSAKNLSYPSAGACAPGGARKEAAAERAAALGLPEQGKRGGVTSPLSATSKLLERPCLLLQEGSGNLLLHASYRSPVGTDPTQVLVSCANPSTCNCFGPKQS